MDLKNCSVLSNRNYLFGIKCLGPLDFINTNTTMTVTLYNCPLDCFFDWNTTQIKISQSINVSRQFYRSSTIYYLSSKLFARQQVVCGPIIDYESTSTYFAQTEITSTTAHSPIISRIPTTTERPIPRNPFICNNGKIGFYCNITADICSTTKPCLNNGTCLNTNSSFTCLCPPSKFTGLYCEIDIRPCKLSTCLSHGTCIETSPTSFFCQCDPGYEGVHCENLINYCQNVQCQNNGQCRPSLLNFTCECTTTDFSGRYCEIKSASLQSKQTVNRSLGYIAIIAIGIVLGFIVLLDVLKYVFHVDPVGKARRQVQAQKRLKSKRRPIAIRFIYVNKPEPEMTIEEA